MIVAIFFATSPDSASLVVGQCRPARILGPLGRHAGRYAHRAGGRYRADRIAGGHYHCWPSNVYSGVYYDVCVVPRPLSRGSK